MMRRPQSIFDPSPLLENRPRPSLETLASFSRALADDGAPPNHAQEAAYCLARAASDFVFDSRKPEPTSSEIKRSLGAVAARAKDLRAALLDLSPEAESYLCNNLPSDRLDELGMTDWRYPTHPRESLDALYECLTRLHLPDALERVAGSYSVKGGPRRNERCIELFDYCAQIWCLATQQWPPLTKDNETGAKARGRNALRGGVASPLFDLMREAVNSMQPGLQSRITTTAYCEGVRLAQRRFESGELAAKGFFLTGKSRKRGRRASGAAKKKK